MKDSTVGDLNDLHRKARSGKSRFEPEWLLNLAYTTGNQWHAVDSSGRLYKPSMPRSRITVVDNRILPAIQVEIARMTRSDPVFTVTPNTRDEMDTNAADLGSQVMRFLWKHLNLPELTLKALRWSRICGAGFLKIYWDSTLGDSTEVLMSGGEVLTHPATGRPLGPNDVPQMEGVVVKRISQGDLRVEVRSPFQMFVDPLADSLSEAEWVIEESVKSVEYVQRRYQVALEADTPANPGLVEARMGGGTFTPGQGSYKGVKVREYWCRPCATHPQGRRAVWAVTGGDGKKVSGQMLAEDNQPFDPMPYVMFSGIPIPGRFWPESVAGQLRGPQTELNKIKSQIAENRNRVGNPTILASKQAVQDPDKFVQSTTVPGGVYFFDDIGSQNAVPTILQAPPLPEYVVQSAQMAEESIQEVSGQHDVSSAQVPPGVTAASAINLLQEADDTRLGPAMRDYENQLGEFGQKALKLVARYYTDARTIRLAGDDGAWEIFDFRGAMLRENTHVEVQAGSAFPQSKAAKQAWMQDMMTFIAQAGIPMDPQRLAQFLKDADLGGAERLIEEYSRDEQQVNRENMLLAQGQQLNINDYDNDDAHVAVHTGFQKSARYSQVNPQAQQAFEAHVALHRQRQANMAQAQQQMALQAQQQAQQPPPDQAQAQQAQQGQQMQLQAAQGQQQMDLKDAQQAQSQGQSAQQAQQQLHHAEQAHQQKLQHQQELHELRLAQQAAQARQRQSRGGPSGRH